jgi:hypothetical protein
LIVKIVAMAAMAGAFVAASALAFGQDADERKEAGPAPAAELIVAPADPVAGKAFEALERRCAACHQAGRLAPGGRAAAFANVLELKQIAKDPDLVLPGNPHGSRLFTEAIKLQAPHHALSDGSADPKALAEDLLAVHDWIGSLGADAHAGCIGRDLIDMRGMLSAIAADVEAQLGRRRKGMRYLTLSHLHNGCAGEPAMNRFRQGAVKLLNGLSRGSEPVALRTVDEAKTIIAFNLGDLKWSPEDWSRLIASYPYGVQPTTTLYDTVVGQTETPLPWLRADWFAYTGSRAPLYYELLKLPVSYAELEKQLKIDVAQNIEKLLAARAGLRNSTQSEHNRLIERHGLEGGYFWTTYDFRSGKPEQNLLSRPLGPAGDNPFQYDDSQTLFSLANGFVAYFLSNSEGRRQDSAWRQGLSDPGLSDHRVRNAISCLACHVQGVRRGRDEIRDKVLADLDISAKVREKIEALYKPADEMDKLLDQDAERFGAAMRRAGLDPDLDAAGRGVESITFLSRQYGKALGLRQLAAEYGITPAALAEALEAAGDIKIGLKRRLEQGRVPRRLVENQFADLIAVVSDDEPIKLEAEQTASRAAAEKGFEAEPIDFDLALTSDKSLYRVGETPVLTVSSERDCYLTLTRVAPKGRARVIFPNKSQRDNFLLERTLFRFPPEKNRSLLRLKAPGKETVIARCNAEGARLSGGEDDFKRRRQSGLGDYRGVLTRQIIAAARKANGRGPGSAGNNKSPPAIARTAITFDVE